MEVFYFAEPIDAMWIGLDSLLVEKYFLVMDNAAVVPHRALSLSLIEFFYDKRWFEVVRGDDYFSVYSGHSNKCQEAWMTEGDFQDKPFYVFLPSSFRDRITDMVV